ncbi:peptide ABC transporter ATP-binding protein [Acidihalobacter yilgarnensis]|uniref:Peptide ABC transporter ATP-binding protein n=1 Tax=Acidihalobacter yilgarnensis TaxID=2819280 RepID=A0A1D8IJX3_9GAMM|nr:ABC transporter ATP-binding protein [Acidihalobacter yilgarnensis]AOU96756.1 peptide ABC transporter ATP-binding protein [Acidihalobacter yilgarnensis]
MSALDETFRDAPLTVTGLQIRYPVKRDWLGRPRAYAHALNGIDLSVARGETLGIVGESGCGKSTLAQALIGLVTPSSGHVRVAGMSSTGGLQPVQIVFQDPNASLDPRMRVWRIITEPVFLRSRHSRAELRRMAAALAEQVGLRAEHIDRYAHEFSGGQRQRIAIARALASEPEIIVLDEPTSALDVSVQAQILNLLLSLQQRQNLTYVLISHDVSVIRHMADRVAVMYLGQIVEIGPARSVLGEPRHPYTRLLCESVPRVDSGSAPDLPAETTELPSNRTLPSGCFFRERCPSAAAGCERPQALATLAYDTAHAVRCHLVHADTPPKWRPDTLSPLDQAMEE